MRSPNRKRPLVRVIAKNPPSALADIAERVKYVGSAEHKDTPSFAGQPRPYATASLCDRELAHKQLLVNRWLRTAIRKGAVSEFFEGEFPRYVWFKRGDTVFEGRLINREAGWYKGYPLNGSEWPQGIDAIYE
jgi:hypothetical protein